MLRELEFKKPQLDELVITADHLKTDINRKQLQHKGKYIRTQTIDVAKDFFCLFIVLSEPEYIWVFKTSYLIRVSLYVYLRNNNN